MWKIIWYFIFHQVIIFAMDLRDEEKDHLLEIWHEVKSTPQAMDDILVTFMKSHPEIFDKFSDLCDKPSYVILQDETYKEIKSKMVNLGSTIFRIMEDDKQLEDLAVKLAILHLKFDIDAFYLQKAPEELTKAVKDSLPEGLSPVANEALMKILRELACRIEKHMD